MTLNSLIDLSTTLNTFDEYIIQEEIFKVKHKMVSIKDLMNEILIEEKKALLAKGSFIPVHRTGSFDQVKRIKFFWEKLNSLEDKAYHLDLEKGKLSVYLISQNKRINCFKKNQTLKLDEIELSLSLDYNDYFPEES